MNQRENKGKIVLSTLNVCQRIPSYLHSGGLMFDSGPSRNHPKRKVRAFIGFTVSKGKSKFVVLGKHKYFLY